MSNMLKTRKLLLVTTVALINFLVMGCGELYEIPEDEYYIKKGEHKSEIKGSLLGNGVRSLKSSSLRFTVRFDASAVYDLGPDHQGDVNPLFGFSDCSSFHKKNSARFGWAYDLESGRINLFAFVYKNSERVIKILGQIDINATHLLELGLTQRGYEFNIGNNESVVVERGSTCDNGLYYLLYPYFGGNSAAPHDISIFIRELYD